MKNKIIITLLVIVCSQMSMAQVGIGTTTPNASAKLDITSTTQGFLPPRVALTSTSDATTIKNAAGTSITPATGLFVYNTATAGISPNNVTPGFYYYNGTSWINISSVSTFGDVKTGFQSGDHNGWIRLDGRLKSTLSAAQQAQATALGIGANLPNASNAFLVQNGQALGSVTGSNTITIAQNQLPNVNFVGQLIEVAHGGVIQASASGVFTRVNGGTWGNAGGGGNTNTFNLNIPLNGGVTQQNINIAPQSLSVNTFIYLGY
jgi:hypothetical protein